MQMLYNSDQFVVVQIELPPAVGVANPSASADDAGERRGGYEIVDKFARKEIFLEGALARSFRDGVEALARAESSEEDLDDYIGRFAALVQHPIVMH
jgi:hypothetical protein